MGLAHSLAMSTEMATHYCWAGCGCLQEAARREGFVVSNIEYYEQLDCTCNVVWLCILPPPPCPRHSIVYAPKPYLVTETSTTFELSDDTWWKALAANLGPKLMQELLTQLLWPLLGEDDA